MPTIAPKHHHSMLIPTLPVYLKTVAGVRKIPVPTEVRIMLLLRSNMLTDHSVENEAHNRSLTKPKWFRKSSPVYICMEELFVLLCHPEPVRLVKASAVSLMVALRCP